MILTWVIFSSYCWFRRILVFCVCLTGPADSRFTLRLAKTCNEAYVTYADGV